MFKDLFKLYKKNGYSDRSPLEDFNTEVFAGILRLCPHILNDFTTLLILPEDEYEVVTQLHRGLADRADCIIDLVLKGKENVCFIENKVNSVEGWEQLDRYCQALDFHYKGYNKFLVYCTKYTDHKTGHRHNFKQIRWYQIAEILRRYTEEDAYLLNYLEFLNQHNMSQKNTFSPEMVIAMENIKDAAETMRIHVQNSLPHFENIFNVTKTKSQEKVVDSRDRVASFISPILPGSDNNELLYCIKSSLVKLQTQVFINASHPKIDQVKKGIESYMAENGEAKLDYKPHPKGFVIFMDRKIYDLINDADADDKIKNWFIDSFYEFSKFFKSTPELEWISTLLDRDIFYEYKEFLRLKGYKPSSIQEYAHRAKKFTESGWKSDQWGNFESYSSDKDSLKQMRSLTIGDHGQEYKGKTNFRRFLELKIDEQESSITSN